MRISHFLFITLTFAANVLNVYLVYDYLSGASIKIPYAYANYVVYIFIPGLIATFLILLKIDSNKFTIAWFIHLGISMGFYWFFTNALNRLPLIIENNSLTNYDSVVVIGRNEDYHLLFNVHPKTTVRDACACRNITFPDSAGIQFVLAYNGLLKRIPVIPSNSPIYDDQIVLKILSDSVSYISFENGKSWKRIEQYESPKTNDDLNRIFKNGY